jgi:ABC-type sugar transport system permease subunit
MDQNSLDTDVARDKSNSRWAIIQNEISEKGLLVLFLMPALVVLLLAQGYPLIYSLYLSFIDFTLAKSTTPGGFVGFDNFIRALQDSVFQNSIRISLTFAIIATATEMLVGLLLAYLLVGERIWTRLWRTILIMPMVIAPVAVGTIWRMLLNSRAGLVNHSLSLIGIDAPNWLGGAKTAFTAILWVEIWQWTPFVIVIYVAALTALPSDPIRAAQVDGASRWQIFRYIILPLLLPVTVLVLMFRLIDTIMVLDIVYTLTFGGPGFSTNTMSFLIYQQGLRYFNLSFASISSRY